MGSAVLVVVSLLRMRRERLVMGLIHCFGMIDELEVLLFVSVSGGCLN